jgi:SWI/SNF-related matrix-associated actin-dependent regulator of chromatin subfamily A3
LKAESHLRKKAHQALKLKKDKKGLLLLFPDDAEFGLLNNLATKALEDILTWPSIETDATVVIKQLRETLGRATKAADAKTRVSINVYGSVDIKDKVGQRLSKEKIYLQKPDSRKRGTIYDNPHIITFPEFHSPSSEMPQEEELNGIVSSNSVLNFEKTVSQVYASLTRGTNLDRIEGDGRLRTKLLP